MDNVGSKTAKFSCQEQPWTYCTPCKISKSASWEFGCKFFCCQIYNIPSFQKFKWFGLQTFACLWSGQCLCGWSGGGRLEPSELEQLVQWPPLPHNKVTQLYSMYLTQQKTPSVLFVQILQPSSPFQINFNKGLLQLYFLASLRELTISSDVEQKHYLRVIVILYMNVTKTDYFIHLCIYTVQYAYILHWVIHCSKPQWRWNHSIRHGTIKETHDAVW